MATLIAAGLAMSCSEELRPAPDESAAVPTMRVNTARGPITMAYENIKGWAVAEGDMVLGRIKEGGDVSLRDTHVGDRRWDRGIIPYVWDISDGFPNDLCATDDVQFCAGEMLHYETEGSPWRKFVDAVASETTLSLVNATACYYDPGCRSAYMTDGYYVLIRRPFVLNDNDNTQVCDALNNITQQITVVTFTSSAMGQWDLTIAGETFSVAGNLTPNQVADLLDQEIIDWELYDDLPVTVDVDGNVMTITGTESTDVEITLITPAGADASVETTQNACVGAKACANSDCPGGEVCVAVWPYPEWGNDNQGFCQQMNGFASVGPGDPEWNVAFMGLPLGWFHGENYSGMGHELLHAAGFAHEQQRLDAGQVVTVADESCLVIPVGNFDPWAGANLYGWSSPIDFASTMMYASQDGCSAAPACAFQGLNAKPEANCPASVCGIPNPVFPNLDVIKSPGWSEGNDDFGKGITDRKINTGTLSLSYGDQDALRMYAGDAFAQAFVEGQCPWFPNDELGIPGSPYIGAEAGDQFGAALALGQFGDEDHAIVVGSPGEAEDHLGVAAGAATVWESTQYTNELPDGVTDDNRHMPALPSHAPDQFMVPNSFDWGAAPEQGDRFGAAVVAVDLDGDGIDEIAVGAPDGGINNSGVVYIYRTGNSKRKHAPWKVLHPSDHFAADGTRDFGAALAAGNFARGPVSGSCDNLREELAVGSPGGDANGGTSGSVVVFRLVNGDVTAQRTLVPAAGGQQRFGQALVAADFDGDGQDGLVVGAPAFSTDRGRVLFYEQETITGDCSMPFDYVMTRNGTHSGVKYGSALAAGDFLRGTSPGYGFDDIAVGALGSSAQAGYVDIFRGRDGNDPLFVQQIQQATVSNPHALDFGADPIGDEFGFALAVVPHTSETRPAYLLVGAPGEIVDNFATGVVYQLSFSVNSAAVQDIYLGGKRETLECDAGAAWGCGLINLDDQEWGHRFGAALAADERVIVMGDPGFNFDDGNDHLNAGAMRIYVRERDATLDDEWYLMHWQAESVGWPTAPDFIAPP